MKVTFMDGHGEEVLYTNVASQEEGFKLIFDHMTSRGLNKSQYFRYWRDEERKAVQCDIGSWSSFYFVYD